MKKNNDASTFGGTPEIDTVSRSAKSSDAYGAVPVMVSETGPLPVGTLPM